jgi:hypothetical protein
MLHEVLLALTGIIGDVVKCTSDRRGFCIASDIRFLEASECANLHKLCSLGSMYQKISQRCKYILDVCASSGVPVNSSFAHVHDILIDECAIFEIILLLFEMIHYSFNFAVISAKLR